MLTNVSNTGVVASTPAPHHEVTNNGDHRCWQTATGTGAQLPLVRPTLVTKRVLSVPLNGERPSTQHGGVSFCLAPAACLAVESICCASPHRLLPLSPTHGPGSTVVWHQLTLGPIPSCVAPQRSCSHPSNARCCGVGPHRRGHSSSESLQSTTVACVDNLGKTFRASATLLSRWGFPPHVWRDART